MAVATHPAPETLAAFARGDLPPTELASVAEHVGGCAACCAALSRVPDDTLAGLARAAAVRSPGATPAPLPAAAPGAKDSPDGTPAALADHPRYKILRELGAGGMGVVYKAEHRIMGRVVALKVVAPHLTAKAGAVERFRKEVRAAASLNHPNIVTAHDADEAGGMHFLVMEYVEGTSLDRLVAKKGPLSVPLACSFARQAASGLQHAHDKGMVHRDIKPQNLMVTRKAQVKVMDFGLARFVGADAEEAPAGRVPFGAAKPVADPVTNPNLLMGTPDYLSPEQAKNSHAVDHRSDLYSLGCTLHFLLTGRPPFAHASSLIDKLLAHTGEAPASVRGFRPDVPEALEAVLGRMLAKNPDDRYPSAAEVASALHPFTKSGEGEKAGASDVVDAVLVPAHPGESGSGGPAWGVSGPPSPAVTPAPAPVQPAGAFEFDTAPVPDGPTVVEAEQPRRPRKSKRAAKARPWWKRTGVLVAAGAVLLAVVAGVVASRGKKADPSPELPADPPKTAANAKPAAPPKPNPFRPGGKPNKETLPLLYVVPSDGVYGPDYHPVVQALKDRGVSVKTASGRGEPASLYGQPAQTIPVDVKLKDVEAAEYSGVAFCGYEVNEYVLPTTRGVSEKTKQLLADVQAKGRPVAAICVGQRVLANHGVLKGKFAARSKFVVENFPGLEFGGMTWKDEGVVVARGESGGAVVTAAGPDDAKRFAEALAKAVAE